MPISRISLKQRLLPAIVGLVLLAALVGVVQAGSIANKDFICYWTAGRLAISHANPYGPGEVLALEHTQGFTASPVAFMMRNPPPALLMVAPLGLLSLRVALIAWTLLSIACLVACFRLLKVPRAARLFVYFFAPLLATGISGQSSPILLLGVALFLAFHEEKPALAGAGLFLLTLKPHLFLVFGAVILLDAVVRRRWALLISGGAILGAISAAVTLLWPQSWHQYAAMLHGERLDIEYLQNLSHLLRHALAPGTTWVQFLPALAGTLWGVGFYWQRRHRWQWRQDGLLLLLVSLLVAPYSWFTDEVILLPALIALLGNAQLPRAVRLSFLLLNTVMVAMVFSGVPLTHGAYLWTPAAWLLWYLFTERQLHRVHDPESTFNTARIPAIGR